MSDPFRFPALAAIDRESRLPARRDGGEPRPQNARLDRPPLEAVVADEGADPVLEPAANRRGDRRRAPAVEPPAQPLARRRVERADADPAKRPTGSASCRARVCQYV